MGVKLVSASGGSVEINPPTTASNFTATLAAGTGTIGLYVQGTAVASTSGTSIDFTGIPSWVKRITVMFDGVSVSGTSSVLVQLGDSGGLETTGYVSFTGETPTITSTAGFAGYLGNATRALTGFHTIVNLTTNTWVANGNFSNANNCLAMAGSKTLSATLDRVRITTVNGTDTFDAGSVNILYE